MVSQYLSQPPRSCLIPACGVLALAGAPGVIARAAGSVSPSTHQVFDRQLIQLDKAETLCAEVGVGVEILVCRPIGQQNGLGLTGIHCGGT